MRGTSNMWVCAAGLVASLAGAAVGVEPVARQPREAASDQAIKAAQAAWEALNIKPAQDWAAPDGIEQRGACSGAIDSNPNLALPDFAGGIPGVVTDTIVTGGAGTISDLNVELNIATTWQGDIIVTLTNSFRTVTIVNRPGGVGAGVGFSADNYGSAGNPFILDDEAPSGLVYDTPQIAVANVAGSWLPDLGPLSQFDGDPAADTWTITVSDNAGGDIATLQRWAICSPEFERANPSGVGSANPNPVGQGGTTVLSVAVTPATTAPGPSTGITVDVDTSPIGGGTVSLLDDGNPPDATADDLVFSGEATALGAAGTFSLPFTVEDAEGRSSMSTLSLGVVAGNDICLTAIPLTIPSTTPGSNLGSTNDPGQPTCVGVSATFNLGVWYSVTGTGNVVEATTCNPGTTYNTRLYAYTGSCGSLVCVTANTVNVPACSPTTAATVSFCSTLGQTYYLLVCNDTAGTGNFELTVSDLGPCLANDLCAGAVPLSVPSATVGSTVGATIDGGAPTCTAAVNRPGVWYTVTGNGNRYKADTCDISSGQYDTRLTVYCGGETVCSSLSGLTCITGIDNATLAPPNGCGSGSQQSRVDWCTQDGAEYMILVHGGTGTQGSTGTFTLTLEDLGTCTGAVACIPLGACCVDGVCTVTTEIGCAGEYLGDGTNCFAATGSVSPATAIPDSVGATPGVATSQIVVVSGGTISDLNVGVIITHTWQGDLSMTLTHDDTGTTTTLVTRPGNPQTTFGFSADNYGNNSAAEPFILDDEAATTYDAPQVAGVGTLNVTGSWLPDLGPLSIFDGESIVGTWTLTVTDNAGGDTGTIRYWALQDQDATACPDNACPPDFSGNGITDVPDIFLFLAGWFANTPGYIDFGGTPGVPAIFAFLAAWFGGCP